MLEQYLHGLARFRPFAGNVGERKFGGREFSAGTVDPVEHVDRGIECGADWHGLHRVIVIQDAAHPRQVVGVLLYEIRHHWPLLHSGYGLGNRNNVWLAVRLVAKTLRRSNPGWRAGFVGRHYLKRACREIEVENARIVFDLVRAVVRRGFALRQQIQRRQPLLAIQNDLLLPDVGRRNGGAFGGGRRGCFPEQQAAGRVGVV